jgi:hypothetical protein
MIPIVVVLGGAFAIMGLRLALRSRRVAVYVRFCGMALACFLLLGNIEVLRAARAIPAQLKAVAGGHVAWSTFEFWAAAMGLEVSSLRPSGESLRSQAAALLLSLAFVVGMVRVLRRRRARVLALAVGLLFLLAAYFHFVATNPWTGRTGHSWSLFKVIKWAYPLLVTVQFAGIHSVIRLRRGSRPIVGLASLLAVM